MKFPNQNLRLLTLCTQTIGIILVAYHPSLNILRLLKPIK